MIVLLHLGHAGDRKQTYNVTYSNISCFMIILSNQHWLRVHIFSNCLIENNSLFLQTIEDTTQNFKVSKLQKRAVNGWRALVGGEREGTRQTMHAADKRLGRALSQLINQPATDKQTQLERWGTAYRSRRFRSMKSRSISLRSSLRRCNPLTLEILPLDIMEKENFIQRKVQRNA